MGDALEKKTEVCKSMVNEDGVNFCDSLNHCCYQQPSGKKCTPEYKIICTYTSENSQDYVWK